MQNHSEEPIPARLGKCSVLSEFIRLKTQVFLKWRKELFLCMYRKHGALSNKSAIEETGVEKMGGVPFLIFLRNKRQSEPLYCSVSEALKRFRVEEKVGN